MNKEETYTQGVLRKLVAKAALKGFTYKQLYKQAGWHSSDWNAHWKAKRRCMSADMEIKITQAIGKLKHDKSNAK